MGAMSLASTFPTMHLSEVGKIVGCDVGVPSVNVYARWWRGGVGEEFAVKPSEMLN